MKIAYKDVNRHSCLLIACLYRWIYSGRATRNHAIFVSFCGHFVFNFFLYCKNWLLELINWCGGRRPSLKEPSSKSPEISNYIFRANYMTMFFFSGLSRCQVRLATGSLSRYAYTTVFTVKNWPLNENTVNIVLKCVQNARNYLSNERFCVKFGRFFSDTLQSEYQEI